MNNTLEVLHLNRGRLNILTKVLADIFSPEEYWNQNTIIDYVKHLYSKRLIIGVTDEEIYDRIEMIKVMSEDGLSKQWKHIH